MQWHEIINFTNYKIHILVNTDTQSNVYINYDV